MAQGSIRIRCKVCRKAGIDESECKSHKERVFNVQIPGAKSGTFSTKTDADRYRINVLNEINRGTYKRITPLTVQEITEKYLASIRINCSPSCFSGYQYTIAKHIYPTIGQMIIANVTHSMIAAILANIEHMSYSTRSAVRTHLRAIFEFAEIAGALKENPTKKLKIIKRNKQGKRIIVLTNKQIHLLLNATKEPAIKLYYKMALYTGMRPNELGALRIDDINLDKKFLKVAQAIYWFHTLKERGSYPKPYYFKDPKTESGRRIIPLTPELVQDIQIHLIQAKDNKEGLLFARANGDPIHHQIDIMERFFIPRIKALNESQELPKVEFPVIDFYNLRHTYCSILAEMDVPIKKIQYLMGHSDFQTTMNIYAKIRPDQDDDFGGKLEAFVNPPTFPVSTPCQ